MRRLIAFAPLLFLTACDQGGDPMAPRPEPAPSPEVASPPPAKVEGLPGTGPTSFVGRWAADVRWCAEPSGDGRPIEITTTRLLGYENSCDITAITEIDDAYEADLRCEAEGRTTTERVRMAVRGDAMTLTYADRGGDPVQLNKCTTLSETPG